MPTKITPSDVNTVEIEQIVRTVNDQYYKIIDVEQVVRHLENRMDNFVLPASKFFFGAAIVGAAVGGYIAYTEVRRRNSKDS